MGPATRRPSPSGTRRSVVRRSSQGDSFTPSSAAAMAAIRCPSGPAAPGPPTISADAGRGRTGTPVDDGTGASAGRVTDAPAGRVIVVGAVRTVGCPPPSPSAAPNPPSEFALKVGVVPAGSVPVSAPLADASARCASWASNVPAPPDPVGVAEPAGRVARDPVISEMRLSVPWMPSRPRVLMAARLGSIRHPHPRQSGTGLERRRRAPAWRGSTIGV